MKHTNQRLEKVENDVHSMTVHMKSLEMQMSQIAQAVSSQHKPGQFPGQPNVNPKDCKAIYLRSVTSYESPPMPEVEAKKVPEEKEEEEIEVESSLLQSKVQPEAIAPPMPKERMHLNIPLIEALQQMPGYLKFLKEIMSKNKRLVDYETVNLTENCSAIIQQKMPAKMKDPGSFNISCVIGNDRQTKALCDLGASINLMPLSFF
ncbi:uncharacterized protein LOC121788904 [Salvia splendens]|uniref:uncharacterized protein LOC121788904 n=1 Tax=Salvia splendens TaxID=180675 RepID=UPI001C27A58C|nr:uncharacterized protein LOC121788904 [Salvia splendens]